jgi:hypothetical protein
MALGSRTIGPAIVVVYGTRASASKVRLLGGFIGARTFLSVPDECAWRRIVFVPFVPLGSAEDSVLVSPLNGEPG